MSASIPDSWATSGRTPKIAIIGAGMSGIAAVVKLRKAGYTDLTVFEKTDRVGGTWRENTYPGLSCDVPSRWYSFSFALNPDWNYRYSYGPEIQAYMEDTAQRFGVTDIVRFNTPVRKLDYVGPHWCLTTDEETLEYDIVISATGILHQPVRPQIDGLEGFAGDVFHTAQWDHSVSLEGKRVGIIGTGSTAAQVIGAITDKVGDMLVFQRTAQWMLPLLQTKYSSVTKGIMRAFPSLQKFGFWFYYQVLIRSFAQATVGNAFWQKIISKWCAYHLKRNVPDP
ncbi:MAG: NAD(P)/FAD-dependent oxidoreductase, partial [Pseudomonadota bacterium]